MEPGTARAFADLHVHSSASFDSLASPRALVRAAAQRGLTHLAITDHERLDGALRARDAAPPELTVVVGEEVRTQHGDLIGLYLEQPIPAGLPAAEAAARIREQGGLVGLPHPFDRFRSSGASRLTEAAALADLARTVDYVEAHNGRALRGANQRAAAFARDQGLPAVAASDAHSVLEVGVTYTILPFAPQGAREMLEALQEAQIVAGRATLYVRAWTPIAKLVQRLRGNRRLPSVSVPTVKSRAVR